MMKFGMRMRAGGPEIEEAIVGDGRVDRRAFLFPVGDQLVDADGIDDGAGENVRADLGAFLQDADGDVLAGFGGELLQADRGGEAGRPGADDDNVVFHGFARGRACHCAVSVPDCFDARPAV